MTYDDLKKLFPKMEFLTTVNGVVATIEIFSKRGYFKMDVPIEVYFYYGPEIYKEVASHLKVIEERLWQPKENIIL